MSDTQDVPRRMIKSLDELGKRQLNIEIEMDGEVLLIPIKALSFRQWQDSMAAVPNPSPPITGVDKNDAPIYNRNDAAYLRQLSDAANKRMLHMLVKAIQVDVPGETEQAKLEFLESLEYGVLDKLVALMAQFNQEVDAQIEDRAASFRTARTGGQSDMPPDALDTEPVATTE